MARSKLPVGAHLEGDRLLQQARSLGADCIQIFLGSPQSWKAPPPHPEAKGLKASKRDVYVHAPYLINVCSPRSNVRYGSRKILQQTCEATAKVGAKALIVHPGHAEDGIKAGVGRWARTLEMLESPVPVYLENTAGGDNAVARRFDALAKLWDAVSGVKTEVEIGFCFDTCHAHAAGRSSTMRSSGHARSRAGWTCSTSTTPVTRPGPAPTATPTSARARWIWTSCAT